MINTLEMLQQDSVTTGEAILLSYQLAERYIRVLENIIRIKQKNPSEVEDDSFRVQRGSTDMLVELRDMLLTLEQELQSIETTLQERQPS